MSFGEIVPQVFYDVIARLVAGLTIIGTCAAIWWPEIQGSRAVVAAGLEDASIVTALAFLIGAYVLALLLEGLGPYVVDWPLERLEDFWKKRKEKAEEDKGSENGKPENGEIWLQSVTNFNDTFGGETDPSEPSEAIAMDFIRLENSDVGARIVKLRAEASLCRSLVVGWLAVAVACSIFAAFFTDTPVQGVDPNANSMANPWIVLPILAVACIAIHLRRQRLRERCLTAIFNHWLLLVGPREMSRCSAKGKEP